jgi:hypothetical protein
MAWLRIPVATTIISALLFLDTAGSALTSGQQCFAALYSSSGTLLSVTADQSTAWVSTGLRTMALATAAGAGNRAG